MLQVCDDSYLFMGPFKLQANPVSFKHFGAKDTILLFGQLFYTLCAIRSGQV